MSGSLPSGKVPHVNVGILIVIIICTILSAFFSMSETALSSISEAKVRTLVEDRRTGSKKALFCIEHFEKILTTILVGNNIVNTAMSVVAVGFFADIFINQSADIISLLATIIMTVILLICGEILPKTLGKKYNEKISLIVGPIIWFLSYMIYTSWELTCVSFLVLPLIAVIIGYFIAKPFDQVVRNIQEENRKATKEEIGIDIKMQELVFIGSTISENKSGDIINGTNG